MTRSTSSGSIDIDIVASNQFLSIKWKLSTNFIRFLHQFQSGFSPWWGGWRKPLFSNLYSIIFSILDPVGEKHYPRRASWFSALLVVVSNVFSVGSFFCCRFCKDFLFIKIIFFSLRMSNFDPGKGLNKKELLYRLKNVTQKTQKLLKNDAKTNMQPLFLDRFTNFIFWYWKFIKANLIIIQFLNLESSTEFFSEKIQMINNTLWCWVLDWSFLIHSF